MTATTSPARAERIACEMLAAQRIGAAEPKCAAHAGLEQLRLLRGSEHEFGLGLRLKAVRHDLAPNLLNQRRRSPLRAGLQPVENLRLPSRPQLQAAVAFGVLDRRDLGRHGKPPLDQIENLVVDSIQLSARCREPSQLFIYHGSSRSVAA